MSHWSDVSNYEAAILFLLMVLCVIGMIINGKLGYLVRLKEIELRKSGVIEKKE